MNFDKFYLITIPATILAVLIMATLLFVGDHIESMPYDNSDFVDNTSYIDDSKAPPAEETTEGTDTTAEADEADKDVKPDEIDIFFSSYDSTATLVSQGLTISDKPYADGDLLSIQNRNIAGTNLFSLRTVNKKAPVCYYDEARGGFALEIKEIEEEQPLVDLYMDFVFVDNGGTFKIYDRSGRLIFEAFDTNEFVPTYTRDKDGHPLFAREEISENSTSLTKYYYLDEIGALLESEYIPFENTFTPIDQLVFPSGFTPISYSEGIVLLEKNGAFGYVNSQGEWICNGSFSAAEPFSNGLAVVERGGKAGLIDKNGEFVVLPLFDKIIAPAAGLVALYDETHGWAVMNNCCSIVE